MPKAKKVEAEEAEVSVARCSRCGEFAHEVNDNCDTGV
jgi:hypothetical protein